MFDAHVVVAEDGGGVTVLGVAGDVGGGLVGFLVFVLLVFEVF